MAKATLVGEVAVVLFLMVIYRFAGFSRVVFFLDAIFSTALLLGIRQSFSLLHNSIETWTAGNADERRVFVLGTSEPTELALSYLRSQRISCAGLIETNGGGDLGRLVWGMPVVGNLTDLSCRARLARLANQHDVYEIVVTTNGSLPVSDAELLELCDRTHVRLLKLGLYPVQNTVGDTIRSSAREDAGDLEDVESVNSVS
jgi:FlaA1/EpsC-like NDP-sugar epimerase